MITFEPSKMMKKDHLYKSADQWPLCVNLPSS